MKAVFFDKKSLECVLEGFVKLGYLERIKIITENGIDITEEFNEWLAILIPSSSSK